MQLQSHPASAEARSDSPVADAPFFIVGCGRSGTTLLRVILLGHSRLNISPETHFIRGLVDDFPLRSTLLPEQVAAVVDVMVAHPRWRAMGMPADLFRDSAMALRQPLMADVLNLVYQHHAREAGKVRSGDKTPDYVRYIPQLLEIYPDAKFIHLIRDGHDVAMSYATVGWGQAYQGERFEWSQAVRSGLTYRRAPFADRILEVRYEDMVRDLEGSVRRICAFLGETFEPEMLDWHSRIELLFPGEDPNLHRKLYQPLMADAVSTWRRKLSAVECFIMEASLRRDLQAMNYDMRYSAPVWRPFLAAAGLVMHQLAPLLDRAIPALKRRKLLPRPLYI